MPAPRPRSTILPAVLVMLVLALIAAACGSSDSPTGAPESAEPAPTPVATQAPIDDSAVEAAVAAFLEQQSSDGAVAIARAAAENGSPRWVPWLVDLLRLGQSTQVSNQIGMMLAELTGIPSEDRVTNMINYGAWAHNEGLDGGSGYRDFKVTLYTRIDSAFGPLLATVQDQTELAAIQWGGVPLGGIPELNDPTRVAAAEADWMVDDEIVLGVIANGEAVAYPLRILARHELANDTIGGDRLALVYCTLCRSALVFERDVQGQTLNFLTSGLLLNSNKIMYDPETETLWHHLRGLGIGGQLVGTELTLRSVNHMRWSDWVAENPDTQVLALPKPIFFDDPERPPIAYDYTPGEAYASYYDNPDVWFPVLDTPDVFDLKTEVLGIRNEDDAIALDILAFNDVGETVEIEVGGEVFTIEPTGVGARVFDDAGERVITEQSFWFAWFANNPDTRTWSG